MKLTKEELKRIIMEETQNVLTLNENEGEPEEQPANDYTPTLNDAITAVHSLQNMVTETPGAGTHIVVLAKYIDSIANKAAGQGVASMRGKSDRRMSGKNNIGQMTEPAGYDRTGGRNRG
jgi:hypothetical protein